MCHTSHQMTEPGFQRRCIFICVLCCYLRQYMRELSEVVDKKNHLAVRLQTQCVACVINEDCFFPSAFWDLTWHVKGVCPVATVLFELCQPGILCKHSRMHCMHNLQYRGIHLNHLGMGILTSTITHPWLAKGLSWCIMYCHKCSRVSHCSELETTQYGIASVNKTVLF